MKTLKLYNEWLKEHFVDVELPPTSIDIRKGNDMFKYNHIIIGTIDIPYELFEKTNLSPRLTFPMIMEGIYDTDKFGKIYMTFDYVEPGVHFFSGYTRFINTTYMNVSMEITRYTIWNSFKTLIKDIVFEKMKVKQLNLPAYITTIYNVEEILKEEGEI